MEKAGITCWYVPSENLLVLGSYSPVEAKLKFALKPYFLAIMRKSATVGPESGLLGCPRFLTLGNRGRSALVTVWPRYGFLQVTRSLAV